MADNETEDLELDGEDEGEETEGSEESTEEEPKPKSGEDKRVKDLQSKADKAEARANKAEAALKALQAGEQGNGSKDPERDALLAELRESSLDAVYGEFQELRDFGIDRTLIEGGTRAEMRESATALVGLIKSVATKARNQALKEAGVNPEPISGTRSKPKSYADMSTEDFEKEIARAKGGGSSLW